MEFFALPTELAVWLESLLHDDASWVLRWAVRPNVYIRILPGSQMDPKTKWAIGAGPGPHFFIGSTRLCADPAMVRRNDGSEEINFLDSLCVRLVPGFVDQAVLLEGRLESFSPLKYKKLPNGKDFLAWRAETISSFKEAIFPMTAVVAQMLSGGATKTWDNVFVSQGAIDWFLQGGKLKQFTKGPVEFTPKLLNCS